MYHFDHLVDSVVDAAVRALDFRVQDINTVLHVANIVCSVRKRKKGGEKRRGAKSTAMATVETAVATTPAVTVVLFHAPLVLFLLEHHQRRAAIACFSLHDKLRC